jgi:prepilin-type N-terminal cleavage/methylation domain-containing protein
MNLAHTLIIWYALNKMKKAFTLIELLITLLIIALLATVAIPKYQRYVQESRAGEALGRFKILHQAQEAFYAEVGRYADIDASAAAGADDEWDKLGLENWNAKGNFMYDCITYAGSTDFKSIQAFHLKNPATRDNSADNVDFTIRYWVRDEADDGTGHSRKPGEVVWEWR